MTSTVTPWRTGMEGRPPLPCPPEHMPLLRGGRPLKRWRWVGCFTEDVLLCAAVAHVGPAPLSWWAVWDREARTLAEHTVRRSSAVTFGADGALHVDDGPVTIDLHVRETPGVETVSPHGDEYIWTRKQGGVEVTGTVRVAEREHRVDGRGIVDESAGYHARHTAWRWSAGVGTTDSGSEVAWNLVTGLHDAPEASERTLWVDGEPRHLGPVTFAEDLSSVAFDDGGALLFAEEARRSHSERLLLFSSSYDQPFGTFSGELPGGQSLAQGFGVMERHEVRW